jgi:hypothetical protein
MNISLSSENISVSITVVLDIICFISNGIKFIVVISLVVAIVVVILISGRINCRLQVVGASLSVYL